MSNHFSADYLKSPGDDRRLVRDSVSIAIDIANVTFS